MLLSSLTWIFLQNALKHGNTESFKFLWFLLLIRGNRDTCDFVFEKLEILDFLAHALACFDRNDPYMTDANIKVT